MEENEPKMREVCMKKNRIEKDEVEHEKPTTTPNREQQSSKEEQGMGARRLKKKHDIRKAFTKEDWEEIHQVEDEESSRKFKR